MYKYIEQLLETEGQALAEDLGFDTLDEFQEYMDSISIEDDYAQEMSCDISGFCSGASCPMFLKCHPVPKTNNL